MFPIISVLNTIVMPAVNNENEWMRIIMLLADTQQWLNEICLQTVGSLHPPAKKILTAKTYRLSISGLAHILERHYHKILRHPGTGKFHITLPEILDLLKQAGLQPGQPMSGTLNSMRVLRCEEPIGIDRNGTISSCLVVITDSTGSIITAFPG